MNIIVWYDDETNLPLEAFRREYAIRNDSKLDYIAYQNGDVQDFFGGEQTIDFHVVYSNNIGSNTQLRNAVNNGTAYIQNFGCYEFIRDPFVAIGANSFIALCSQIDAVSIGDNKYHVLERIPWSDAIIDVYGRATIAGILNGDLWKIDLAEFAIALRRL